MRDINVRLIRDIVARLAGEANMFLRPDVRAALSLAFRRQKNKRVKTMIKAIIDNSDIAAKEKLAICQDTGLAVVFAEIGQDVHISGGSFVTAVNEGISSGYKRAYLRNSIVRNPLGRAKPGFAPAVVHTELASGSRVKLTVLPKGFGCENKSKVKMFRPTVELEEIKEFIVNTARDAGVDACPPFVIGVGIGGTQDYACLLAKKALLKKIRFAYPHAGNLEGAAGLGNEVFRAVNRLKIGPMGLGGTVTCLAVNVETYPTHIAGLPVAVNISCHALRSATALI